MVIIRTYFQPSEDTLNPDRPTTLLDSEGTTSHTTTPVPEPAVS